MERKFFSFFIHETNCFERFEAISFSQIGLIIKKKSNEEFVIFFSPLFRQILKYLAEYYGFFFFCKMYTFLFNAKRTGYDGSDSTTRIVQYMSLLKNMKIKHVLLLYLRNGESVRINKGHTTSFGKMAKISKHVLFPDKNPLYM